MPSTWKTWSSERKAFEALRLSSVIPLYFALYAFSRNWGVNEIATYLLLGGLLLVAALLSKQAWVQRIVGRILTRPLFWTGVISLVLIGIGIFTEINTSYEQAGILTWFFGGMVLFGCVHHWLRVCWKM